MNRLASAVLATAFLAASGGVALAAAAPTTTPANSPMHEKAHAAALRHDDADPAEARMTHALNLLEANGYGDFSNFKQDGRNFDAMVSQNGKPFTVIVNPDTNQLTRQS